MRPLDQWDESDLQALIQNQVQESLTLDYKQSSALTNNNVRSELSKDVSSFANSAGGRIIYGIEEAGNLPVAIDAGVDPATMGRERLEQMIDANVKPRIAGLTIKPISLSNGNLAYVIDVPQGTSAAPHMAADNRYHRRQNFTTAAMEDYEVRDVMRRAGAPHPIIRFQWHSLGAEPGRGRLTAIVTNLSSEPVMYALLTVMIDERLVTDATVFPQWDGRSRHTVDMHGRNFRFAVTSRKMLPPNSMPIFKEKRWSILDTELTIPADDLYSIGYRIECPGYAESFGTVLLAQAGHFRAVAGETEILER